MSWAATETGPLPPDFVDDGNVPPTPFTIAPTSTLSGFSFQSLHPPGSVPFFVQGETKLAQVDVRRVAPSRVNVAISVGYSTSGF